MKLYTQYADGVWAKVPDGDYILKNPTELQSGVDRVMQAEALILQLPEDHSGRNSWLLNYGTGKEAMTFRTQAARDDIAVVWDTTTKSVLCFKKLKPELDGDGFLEAGCDC